MSEKLTTENIRQTFAYIQAGLDDDDGYPFVMHVHVEAFDRWLAKVECAAAEKAWGEGHIAGRDYQGDGWNQDAHDPSEDNPYRAAALGLTAGQEGETGEQNG